MDGDGEGWKVGLRVLLILTTGASDGDSDGFSTEGSKVGLRGLIGATVEIGVGTTVDATDGLGVGFLEGLDDGRTVGEKAFVGRKEGDFEGVLEGNSVGLSEDDEEGVPVGRVVTWPAPDLLGLDEMCKEGFAEGLCEGGFFVGLNEGACEVGVSSSI